ncbi:hypothetical protein R50073_47610 [Maricurvus nonylphenolicus]|uniref:helix-turn-helix domain-containing protein n=1 Tax=Maricurvus nonylphenolicus TaxID=1008307 RepID=UPI0036F3A5BB
MGAKGSPPITVIDRLRSTLTHKGISITQLSDYLGVSRQAIYNWMKNGIISQRYVEPLCIYLDIKAEWLLFGAYPEHSVINNCYLTCELKNTLIELLLENYELVAEHNILTQAIQWHGAFISGTQQNTLPKDTDSMREWIDPDYYHMFHHALLRYHLYQDKQKVIFPLHQDIEKTNRWLELEFKSQCNNQIMIYTLQPFKP